MLTKLSKWLLIVALALSIGVHWPLLQSVAWVGMAISYSSGGSITEGLSKTFDGKHPCKLCKFVSEGKKSQRKPDAKKVEVKFDLLYSGIENSLALPSHSLQGAVGTDKTMGRSQAPPVPPPRYLPS